MTRLLSSLLLLSTLAFAQLTNLHSAAKKGDLTTLKAALVKGANPDTRDSHGRTPLMDAAAAGQIESMRTLLAAGAKASLRANDNRTPLIEAVTQGNLEAAQILISAGADLNTRERGWGTPLEAAERSGHPEIAALLRSAGARSSGRSQGDTVCVRPWNGDGYCGTVESVNKNAYRIRVTRIIGCTSGCAPKPECSANRSVGGRDGLAIGDTIDTVSWCLTHTGVQQ